MLFKRHKNNATRDSVEKKEREKRAVVSLPPHVCPHSTGRSMPRRMDACGVRGVVRNAMHRCPHSLSIICTYDEASFVLCLSFVSADQFTPSAQRTRAVAQCTTEACFRTAMCSKDCVFFLLFLINISDEQRKKNLSLFSLVDERIELLTSR